MNPKLRSTLRILGLGLMIHLALWFPFPQVALPSLDHWARGMGEVLLIVPAVLLLLGLFDAWVPREAVAQHLGPGSGLKGVLVAVLLGTGAAGPIYAAFPIGLALRQKGARTANLVIFLGAWATIKFPMLIMESAYLGTRFAMLRLALTLPGLIAAGFAMELLDHPAPDPPPLPH